MGGGVQRRGDVVWKWPIGEKKHPLPTTPNPHPSSSRPRGGRRPLASHTRETCREQCPPAEQGFCDSREVKGAFRDEREEKEFA